MSEFDPAAVHDLLDQAEDAYLEVFDGHVPDEIARFKAFLSTVHMIADQSADRSRKGE